MKLKNLLMPIFALAIILAVTVVIGKVAYEKSAKDRIECAIENPAKVNLEHKEAYKLDDAEYKGAVATKSDFSNVSSAGMGIFSIFLFITGIFRNLKAKDVIVGLFLFGISLFTVESEYAMAVLPLVPFFRAPDGGEGGGVSEKEIKALLEDVAKKNGEAISEAVKNQLGAATKGLVTEATLVESLEKAGVSAKAIKELTVAVEKQGLELNKILTGGGNRIVKTLDEIIAEKGDAIKAMAEGPNNSTLKFKMNADKTMVQSGSVTSSSLSYREQAIGQLAAPNTVFDKVFRTVNLSEADLKASNGVVSYLDVTAETNSAAETAESTGNTVGQNNKPESAITWQEYTQNLRVIADTIPVTRNAYRHLGFIQSEIDRLLRKNQAQRKDTQIYKGDGNAPNIKGIYTFTTAVVLANMPRYANVVNANIADLAMDLAVYVANKADATGAQSKYAPNVLFINPADALKFLVKGNDGHYVLPPFMQNSGKVGNLQIVESSKVTVGTLMVGDASYGTIYQSEDVVIEMGLVNDQFLKNQWTIRAEQELCFLQRNADLGAFVKVTDIDAAIAALTKV